MLSSSIPPWLKVLARYSAECRPARRPTQVRPPEIEESGPFGNRQPHLKVRLAGMRIDSHIALMLADNPVHRVEPEARALTHRLGRKERIEDAALDLVRNTGAVVDD